MNSARFEANKCWSMEHQIRSLGGAALKLLSMGKIQLAAILFVGCPATKIAILDNKIDILRHNFLPK